jgi:hypothetical protein
LSSGKLGLGTSEGFTGEGDLIGSGSNGDEDLSNSDTGDLAETFTVGVSHTGLESISTGAREHLVDANNVPGVDSDSNMEVILTALNLHVLVGSDTGGFESFRGDLLLLSTHHMDATWELIPREFLSSTIVESKFWVGYTSVKS